MIRERTIVLLSAISSIIFLFLFAYNVNPFFLYSGGDPCVFLQVGLAMLQGKIPYLDFFDHKGFLLYCIQALGLFIHRGHWGIGFLYAINLAVTIYFWIKTGQIAKNKDGAYIGKSLSLIPTLIGLMVYALLVQKGNFTECWSLPWISYAVYLFSRFWFLREEITFRSCFGIGAGIGVLSFIRLNNMAPICAMLLIVSVYYISTKKFRDLWIRLLYGMIGFAAVFLFTIGLFWLLYGSENMYWLFFGTFIFNFQYLVNFGAGTILQPIFYLSLFLLGLTWMTRGWRDFLVLAFCFAFTYLTFGKAYAINYFVITVPLYVLGATMILQSLIAVILARYTKTILICITVVGSVGSYVVWPSVKARFDRGGIVERGLKDIHDKLSIVPPNELDSVWNYNARADGLNILQCEGKTMMNRVFFAAQLHVSNELKEIGTIQNIRPLWIMVKNDTQWGIDVDKFPVKDSLFIANRYKLMFATEWRTDKRDDILFYRRLD